MKKLILGVMLGGVIAGLAVTKLLSQPVNEHPDALVTSLNEFNFNFYRQVSSPDSNFIASPYSVSSLLGLCAVGAEAKTRKEFLRVLHIPKLNGIVESLDKINRSWLTSGMSSYANSLWGEKNLNYNQNFLKTLRQSQFNHFYTVNFAKDPEAARETINQWVEHNTHDYITNLLPQGLITKDTQLVLVNAIYFKGLWQQPFDESLTQPGVFYLPDNTTIEVPMMHYQGRLGYSENNVLKMLLLPYSNSQLAMAILLPKSNAANVIQSLNSAMFSNLLSKVHYEEVQLQMPKFKIESTLNSLKSALQTLGLRTAFSDKANFSNMISSPFRLSEAVQKAKIDVDEQGTVAAVASGVIGVTAVVEPKIPLSFVVDHPFLFIIFDVHTQVILFMGQVITFPA